jgi:beta-ribofuranosylaminobenzene 5'-phosphate synthase
MTGQRLIVRTPSRLHFGLLGWGPGSRRQFGGLGLMVRSPCIEIVLERAESQLVEGPLSGRVERILATLRDRGSDLGISPQPTRIRILQAPAEHVGLGVGTQLSLAVATGLLRLARASDPTVEQLARLTGRGRRSGIGLHGFRQGGFLVDGGRKDDSSIPPLLCRLPFPEDWSVLIVQPPGRHGLHGPDELKAFSDLPPVPEALNDRLCRLVLLGILPSVTERDLRTFGLALEELQSHVGAAFAPVQGDIYSSPLAGEIIRAFRREGFEGCGQSSWGPTLYAFSDRPAEEVAASLKRISDRLRMPDLAVTQTRPDNEGARVEVAAATG